jgi:FKBP-type peptidyl-prolyl cis-trans isomerase FkpA
MRMKLLVPVLCAALALTISACGSKSPTDPSQVNVPYSQTDLVVGSGRVAANGNHVSVIYSLWLYDAAGTNSKGVFKESGTFPFVPGAGGSIKGFDQAVVGMAVGGKRRAIVPFRQTPRWCSSWS